MRSLGNFLKRLSLNFYSKETKAKTSQFSSDSCSEQKCVWGEGKSCGEWNLCWETAQPCTQSVIVCKLELGIGNVNAGAIRCSFLANTTWVCSAVLPVNVLAIINWCDCHGPKKWRKQTDTVREFKISKYRPKYLTQKVPLKSKVTVVNSGWHFQWQFCPCALVLQLTQPLHIFSKSTTTITTVFFYKIFLCFSKTSSFILWASKLLDRVISLFSIHCWKYFMTRIFLTNK